MSNSESKAKIRKMTEADLQKVKEVDRKLIGIHGPGSWPLRIEAHWWTYRHLPNFVAVVDKEIVGFLLGDIRGAKYRVEEAGAWIDLVAILPEYQRKGIGHSLVKAFCDECHKEGVKTRIFVRSRDERLTQFWKSCGFLKSELTCYEQ